jgi:hypothetical protein
MYVYLNVRIVSLNNVFVKTKAKINGTTQVLPKWIGELTSVFSKQESFCLPTRKPWDHKIDLKPDAALRRSKAYPLSPQETKALKDYLKENLEKGYIQKSKSPISAPMFFVPKKNGSLRPVQDYRKLNAATIENSYPLPLISKLQDKMTHFRTFAKIDLRWGFNNIRIREGDKYKAAFITNLGLYEPTVMTFGLCNAPAMMQTMMDDLMYELAQTGKIVHYINNIIIGGEAESNLRETTLQVLRKLKDNDLFANAEKFEYDVPEVDILGALVSHGQIRMSPEKVSAILNWPVPRKVSEVRQFQGLANYYRRFVKDFGKICKPLDWLTGKVEWIWGEEEQRAFDTLKAAFTTAPVLMGYNQFAKTRVETDASSYATGAVLLQ